MKTHQILYLFFAISLLMGCNDDTSEFGLINTFVKFYGDANTNVGVKALPTDDGGYLIAGYTNFGDTLLATEVIKTNAFGNEEWSSVLSTSNQNIVKDVIIDTDGNYIFLLDHFQTMGTTITSSDIMVAVVNPSDGTMLDSAFFDSDGLGTFNEFGNGLTKAADGGYIIIGTTTNTTSGGTDTDMYVLRLNTSFDLEWDKIYGNINGLNDAGRSIIEESNGDLVWLGIEQTSSTSSRARMVKTNSLGNILWDFNYPLVENNTVVNGTSNVGDFIEVNGNYVFTGSHSRRGIVLVSVDTDGQELWFRQFTTEGGEDGRDITLGSDNTLVIVGSSGGTTSNMLLLKTDVQGNPIWSNQFGDTGSDEANSVEVTPDGGLVFVGDIFFEGTQMIALTKTNQDGATSE